MKHRYQDLIDILEEVSHVTEIPVSDIKGSSRKSDVSLARQLYCYLAREQTIRSALVIGQLVNRGRDNTLKAIKSIRNLLTTKDCDTVFFISILGGGN